MGTIKSKVYSVHISPLFVSSARFPFCQKIIFTLFSEYPPLRLCSLAIFCIEWLGNLAEISLIFLIMIIMIILMIFCNGGCKEALNVGAISWWSDLSCPSHSLKCAHRHRSHYHLKEDREEKQQQTNNNTANSTNNRQQMPFSLLFILIFSGTAKNYEAARETVEGMKKMTRFCAICLPSKRQCFSLKQFLGNRWGTNGGSLDRRQQRHRFFNTRAQRGWERAKIDKNNNNNKNYNKLLTLGHKEDEDEPRIKNNNKINNRGLTQTKE